MSDVDDILSVSVRLSRGEALKIIVDDLVRKHNHNRERGNEDWCEAFEKVLSYYLTPQELDRELSK